MNINSKMLYMKIKNDLKYLLKQNNFDNFECNTEDVTYYMSLYKNILEDYLSGLKNRNVLNDYNVNTKLIYKSWRKLYGWKFPYAWICGKIIKLFELNEKITHKKWYHKFLMFREFSDAFFNKDEFIDDVVSENFSFPDRIEDFLNYFDMNDYITQNNYYKFIYPYYDVIVDVKIKPVKPLDYININIEVKQKRI